MAQTGYTPIQLYRTTTASAAPTAGNLADGELAINTTDEKLYFKNASGTVKLLAANVTAAANGGTGQTSYTIGDLLYASGTSTLSKLADVATGNALISGGVGVAPSWGKIDLTTHVSGTLPVANGGTNLTSYTTGDILYASGSGTLASLPDVATGNALISGGVGVAPSYGKIGLTTHVTGTLPVANGGTNIAAYGVGDLIYASAPGTLSRLSDVATGNALISGGVGAAPSYGKIGLTTHVTGTLPVSNGGTGTITAFTLGSVVFAGASGTYTQKNANFFWDNTNNRLGINTATPTTALDVNGTIRDSKGDVRTVVQNSQTTAYVLVATDAGKYISITTGGVTVNTGIFSAGDVISIYNDSASNQTITQGTSVTMYLGGTATTGNRTLAQRGICTILCVGSNTFVISGAGVT